MPITFPCACGVTLSVADEPPVYFVRCPRCQVTAKVPQGKKQTPKALTADPGFELVDDARPVIASSAFKKPIKSQEEEEWEKSPYQRPTADGPAYEVGEEEPVQIGATQGDGSGDPYEVTQEEFDRDMRARRKRRSGRKFWRVLWILAVTVFAFAAFIGAGQLTRVAKDASSARAAVGAARFGLVFSWLMVLLIIWLVNRGSDDE